MYDFAVIGAGVCGTQIARLISFTNRSVIVLEQGPDVASGASRANSAVVHAGYDPEPGTLKAKLNVRGAALMEQTCSELDVPYKKTPSLVVAFDEKQMETVKALYERGVENGVGDKLRIVYRDELHAMEKMLSEDVCGALYADSALTCPYKLTVAAAENAAVNGAEFLFDYKVESVKDDKSYFIINDTISAKYVINCAGTGSGTVASLIGDDSVKIIPRRGEYMLYDKTSLCVSSIIFTVPTKNGKGVLVLPTESKNMLVGPNAFRVADDADTKTTPEGLASVSEHAKKVIPSLTTRGVITQFAGVRATPENGDFIIGCSKANARFINVAGIDSPGLASSPAIAEYVFSLLEQLHVDLTRRSNCVTKRVGCPHFADLNADEQERLALENPLFGHIICRCESVTEAEIVDAIRRPLGARTIDGVKIRTRAGMGRCQGGFCSPKVAQILARELKCSITDITKKGGSSYLLTGDTK